MGEDTARKDRNIVYQFADARGRESELHRPLTRKRLVTAALALVDEGHEDVLSMRMLAKRVNRQVSSLYNHVTNRAELVELLRARVVEDVDVSVFSTKPWDEALTAWARSYFRAMANHPYLSRLLSSTPPQDTSTMAMYETIAASLVESGWQLREVVAVIRTVESLVIGSVQDVSGPKSSLHCTETSPKTPTLQAALEGENLETNTPTAGFEVGITALMDGLRRHAGAPGRPGVPA